MIKILPHKQMRNNSCGAAVLFMLFRAVGINKSEEEICDDLELDIYRETFIPQKAIYLKKLGFDIGLFLAPRDHYNKATLIEWYDKAKSDGIFIKDFSLKAFEEELQKKKLIIAGVNRIVYDKKTPVDSGLPCVDRGFEGHAILVTKKDDKFVYFFDPHFLDPLKLEIQRFEEAFLNAQEDTGFISIRV